MAISRDTYVLSMLVVATLATLGGYWLGSSHHQAALNTVEAADPTVRPSRLSDVAQDIRNEGLQSAAAPDRAVPLASQVDGNPVQTALVDGEEPIIAIGEYLDPDDPRSLLVDDIPEMHLGEFIDPDQEMHASTEAVRIGEARDPDQL